MPNVQVGRIMGSHGLKGEVKVEVLTDFAERLDPGRRLLLKDNWITVESSRIQNGRLYLKLSGVDSIDKAQALHLAVLEAPEDERPQLDEDEYVTADLIGLEVVTTDGEVLGTVRDVLLMPAHDVLVVGEIMIPAVKQFVKSIDLPAKRITVALIDGMREGGT